MVTQAELDVLVSGTDTLSPTLRTIESSIIRFVGAVQSSLSALKVAAFPIDAAASFQAQLANVTKTTNFTSAQIQDLGNQLVDLSLKTSTSADDLAKIAAAAGQQGLGKTGVDGIEAFTEAVARMSNVLDISAEDAGNAIGKLINIFKLPITSVEQISSAFNQVSNNSTASGEKLLDIVRRIGDAGGSINLQQSIGLGATAIDLGSSTEVGASTINKLFSSMTSKAQQFSKLLGMTTDQWLTKVKTDGIGALQQLLAYLRTLNLSSQNEVVGKLLGQGRQGVLVEKMVSDVQNEVMNRDIGNATTGFSTGTSALREQQTVLSTLQSQIAILGNSFTALGIKIGNQTLGPFTAFIAQLSSALQSDGVISFLTAVGSALVSIGTSVANAVEWIASLNINWTNFINVGKIWLGLNLGKVIIDLATKFGPFAAVLKSTGDLTVASSARMIGAWATEGLGLDELIAKYKATSAAAQDLNASQDAVAAASAGVATATGKAPLAQKSVGVVQRQTGTAALTAGTATAAYQQAQATAAAAATADQAALEARLETAAAAHDARMLEIETTYEQTMRDGKRRNNSTIQADAQDAYDIQTTQEDRYYARSLSGINTYYSQRAAATAAANAVIVDSTGAAMAAALSEFDGKIATLAASQGNLAAVNAEIAGSTVALGVANAELEVTAVAATAARSALLSVGLALRTVIGAVTGFLSLISGFALWATIIYSVADAFHLFDNVPAIFTSLTDKLGLTSAAMRDAVVAQDAQTRSIDAQRSKLLEITDAYQKYLTVTGQIDSNVLGGVLGKISSGDINQTKDGIAQIGTIAQGALEKLAEVGPGATAAMSAQIDTTKQKLVETTAQIKALQQQIANPAVSNVQDVAAGGSASGLGVVDPATLQLQNTQLATLQANASNYTTQIAQLQLGLAGTAASAALATGNLGTTETAIGSLFTPQSLADFNKYLVPLSAAIDLQTQLKNVVTATNQAVNQTTAGTPARVTAQSAADAAKTQFEAANNAVAQLQANWTKFLLTLINTPGIDPKLVSSLQLLSNFAQSGAANVKAISTVANKAPVAALTGAGIGKPVATASTGDAHASIGQEGEARAEAKARLALAQANANAEIALEQQKTKTILDIDQIAYNQGLISIQAFYADQLTAQQQQNAADIAQRQQELATAQQGAAQADKPSDATRFQADIVKINGQIAVLRAQGTQLVTDNTEAVRQAQQKFADTLLTQANTVTADMANNTDPATYQQNLYQAALNANRVWLNQMRSQIAAGAKYLQPQLDAETYDLQLKSISDTFSLLTKQIDLSNTALSNYGSALTLAVTNGQLTTQEAAGALRSATNTQATQISQEISAMQQQLVGVNANSDAYASLSQQIDTQKLKLGQLLATANATATGINNSITTDLANSLDSLQLNFSSLRTAALTLLDNIANDIKKVLVQNLAESFTKSIGTSGAGGIGGYIQSLMQGPGGAKGASAAGAIGLGAPNGSLASPLYVRVLGSLGLPGTTGTTGAPSTSALFGTSSNTSLSGVPPPSDNTYGFTSDFDGPANDLAADNTYGFTTAATSLTTATTGFTASLSSTFSSLTSSISSIGSSFVSGLSGVFSMIGKGISSLLSGAASGASSGAGGLAGLFGAGAGAGASSAAAAASSSSIAAANTAGNFSTLFGGEGIETYASLLHSGGYAGAMSGTTRSINSSAFAGARRYHAGGIAGLAPDEVPAILRKGERVLTEAQQNAAANAQGNNSSKMVSLKIVPVLDSGEVNAAMNTPGGDTVIKAVMKRNAQEIRSILKIK